MAPALASVVVLTELQCISGGGSQKRSAANSLV